MDYKKKILDHGVSKDLLKKYKKRYIKLKETKEYFYKCAYDFLMQGAEPECLEQFSPVFKFKDQYGRIVIRNMDEILIYYGYYVLSSTYGVLMPYNYFEILYNLQTTCYDYKRRYKYLNHEISTSESDSLSVLKFNDHKLLSSFLSRAILTRPILNYYSSIYSANYKISLMTKILDGIGDAINICYLAEYLSENILNQKDLPMKERYEQKDDDLSNHTDKSTGDTVIDDWTSTKEFPDQIELIIVGYLPQKSPIDSDTTDKQNLYDQNLRGDRFFDSIYIDKSTNQINSKIFFNGKNKQDFQKILTIVNTFKHKDKIRLRFFECPEHLHKNIEIIDIDAYIHDQEHIELYDNKIGLFEYYDLLKQRRFNLDVIDSKTYFHSKTDKSALFWHDSDYISIFYGPDKYDSDMDLINLILNREWTKKYIHITEYGKINADFIWTLSSIVLKGQFSNQIYNQLYNATLFKALKQIKDTYSITELQYSIQEIEEDIKNFTDEDQASLDYLDKINMLKDFKKQLQRINKNNPLYNNMLYEYSTGISPFDLGLTIRDVIHLDKKEEFKMFTDMRTEGFDHFFICYCHNKDHIIEFLNLIDKMYSGKKLVKIQGDATQKLIQSLSISYYNFNFGPFAVSANLYQSPLVHVHICNVYFNNLDDMYHVSEDIVGCTGDNSFTEVISYQKLPYYEVKDTKLKFILSVLLFTHTYKLMNYYHFMLCYTKLIFAESDQISSNQSLKDFYSNIYLKKLYQKQYDSNCKFDFKLALEEAKTLNQIIRKNYDFRNSVYGIIIREHLKKTMNIDMIERKSGQRLNDYLCGSQRKVDPSTEEINFISIISNLIDEINKYR